MNYKGNKQLTLSDRTQIEIGICQRKSFKEIAKEIGKNPSTISKEIKNNRTRIEGNYPAGKDCKNVNKCRVRNLCDSELCKRNCYTCFQLDCRTVCTQYVPAQCSRCDYPPYVCNVCYTKRKCINVKYIYSAKHADAASQRRRSSSRQGPRISEEEYEKLDEMLKKLVKKGQPLSHIFSEHAEEMPVCLRTLYNYIEHQELSVKSIDLRRKVGYKPRKKPRIYNPGRDQEYRRGRTYDDFESYIKKQKSVHVVEMDTVRGVRETGKRLLTMLFRKNHVMLLFLMPDGKAESVKRVFDYLEAGLGVECFNQLFPVILTDNGSEFKRPEDLECTEDGEVRTQIFYCDPMASWQKPHIEKNHEFIRYVIPKGKSLNPYTQEDMILLMNHINSIKRSRLGGRSPYQLVAESDEAMQRLMSLLKMHPIPADEVHLKPDLFK